MAYILLSYFLWLLGKRVNINLLFNKKIKVLFLIQRFDAKKLSDSAGLNEVALPLIQSGKLSAHHIFSWGFNEAFISGYLTEQCAMIKSKVGEQSVTIYGAGAHTEGLWNEFSKFNVLSVADQQIEKIGTEFHHLPIVSPDNIIADNIIISSRAWEEDILIELRKKYPLKNIFLLYVDLQSNIIVNNNKELLALENEVDLSSFDLIFYTPSEPAEALTYNQLTHLKEKSNASLLSIWWDYDDSSLDNVYMNFERATLAVADMIVDPGNYGKTQKLKRREPPYHLHDGVNKVALLPTPVDNAIFYPRKKIIDLAIFGSDVGLRKKWIDLLSKNYPNSFKHIGGVGGGRVVVPMADYARMSGESKIIVNTQTYSFRSQCKGKVREALASGSLLLEEDCYESRCFFDGLDFVRFYKTESELLALVDYYLSHQDECHDLATQGYDWYINNWSPTVWSQKVLDFLAELSPQHRSSENE